MTEQPTLNTNDTEVTDETWVVHSLEKAISDRIKADRKEAAFKARLAAIAKAKRAKKKLDEADQPKKKKRKKKIVKLTRYDRALIKINLEKALVCLGAAGISFKLAGRNIYIDNERHRITFNVVSRRWVEQRTKTKGTGIENAILLIKTPPEPTNT